MRLGFNGATTQTADLTTDIRITGQAGYNVIERRNAVGNWRLANCWSSQGRRLS